MTEGVDDPRCLLLAFPSGRDALENVVVSASEVPITVLGDMGVSVDVSESARGASHAVKHGIHEGVGSIVKNIAEVVTIEASLASEAITSLVKGSRQAPDQITDSMSASHGRGA